MAEKWLVFVALQFTSAIIAFVFAVLFPSKFSFVFMWVGGFFFALGAFGATRWGFERWRGKQKPRKRQHRE